MYSAVRFPAWQNAEHTLIRCDVNFNHVNFEEWTPFTADPNDFMAYSKEIFNKCVAGEFGPIAEYISPYASLEETVTSVVAASDQPNTSGSQTL